MIDNDRIEHLLDRYPSIADLAKRAKRRIPHFAWEYLDSGTGGETALNRNRAALDQVQLLPQFLKGDGQPDTSVELFGKRYDAPVGIAPIGMSGMLWPGSERMLAGVARERGLAYCLSTVGCETPETVGGIAGDNAWFQLYPIADKEAEADLLERAWDSGMRVLVVTVDVPLESIRERQRKSGLGQQGMSLKRLMRVAARPAWAIATARYGAPEFRALAKYVPDAGMAQLINYVRKQKLGVVDWAHLRKLRELWKGRLVVKGIMTAEDARQCVDAGADAVWVSNHGGRQFDAVPAAIDALSVIASEVGGNIPVIFDSGVRSGLDVMRAISRGADFVFAGRAFQYGPCALGQEGAWLAAEILLRDLRNNMTQMGVGSIADLRARV